MRNYVLSVTDSDGETHEYRMQALSAYFVAEVAALVALEYGHNLVSAKRLTIDELVRDADMSDAIDLALVLPKARQHKNAY